MAHYPRPRSTGVGCIDRRDQWRLFFLGPGLFTLTLGRGLFPGVGFAVCGFSGLGFRWCFVCLQCFYLYLRNRDLSIFFQLVLTINTFFQKKILLRKSTLHFLWFRRYLNIPFSLFCYTIRLSSIFLAIVHVYYPRIFKKMFLLNKQVFTLPLNRTLYLYPLAWPVSYLRLSFFDFVL